MKMPALLGIVNATPDSFSDGGTYDPVEHALRLFAEGAAAVDVGGESTRPGAPEVSAEEELRRVVPVVAEIKAKRPESVISVDTRRSAVAAAAIAEGAAIINDVTAGRDPEMFAVCAASKRIMVLMHMRGTPATMRDLARYSNVCVEVWGELRARAVEALSAGVPRVILDPGIGFAKTIGHNLRLLRDLPNHREHEVLVGASRKSFIGAITGQERPQDRLEGSLAVALHCMEAGVAWLRVHDVAATHRALAVRQAIAEGAP